jgi:hypothetical protein
MEGITHAHTTGVQTADVKPVLIAQQDSTKMVIMEENTVMLLLLAVIQTILSELHGTTHVL